jgi:hypothetical protein
MANIEQEALTVLSQGVDSSIPVPVGLYSSTRRPSCEPHHPPRPKLVNGASYTALVVILVKAHLSHRINANTILRFGPSAGILLEAQTATNFHVTSIPSGTILPAPISIKIECQRPTWQQRDISRRRLPCAVTFACTDYTWLDRCGT